MKMVNPDAQIKKANRLISDDIMNTTHMAIGAHPDDVEIMAYDGISKCYGSESNSFCAVIVTNGASSPRRDDFQDYSDTQIKKTRKQEQKKAADIGKYSSLVMLDYNSCDVKDTKNKSVDKEIANIILKARPEIIYTHNLADKHDTHVAVGIRVINAIRTIPKVARPKILYGCEVWRGLDWLIDKDKVALDVSMMPKLAESLLEVYDSQINGGKRYDRATVARRIANATFSKAHITDASEAISFAMDLSPLINDANLSIKEYILNYIQRFKNDVSEKIDKYIL